MLGRLALAPHRTLGHLRLGLRSQILAHHAKVPQDWSGKPTGQRAAEIYQRRDADLPDQDNAGVITRLCSTHAGNVPFVGKPWLTIPPSVSLGFAGAKTGEVEIRAHLPFSVVTFHSDARRSPEQHQNDRRWLA